MISLQIPEEPQILKRMKTEKMKVLLYLKKSSLDKSGKAPIMGRITIGRSIAQFSCKLSCNPDLWNPRESRMNGKSREAVEINGKLENLLLFIQSAYQSLITKGCLFDVTDVKEQFQGSVQARCMLIERLDMLIKEKESHNRYRHQERVYVHLLFHSKTITGVYSEEV